MTPAERLQQVRDIIVRWEKSPHPFSMYYEEVLALTATEPPRSYPEPAKDLAMPAIPTAAKDFGLCLLRGRDREWIDDKNDGLALTFGQWVGPFNIQQSIPFNRDDVIKALLEYFKTNTGSGT